MIIDPYGFKPTKITAVIRQSRHTVSIKLAAKDSFKCGQYLVVRVIVGGTKLTRQYSLSSAPYGNELWLTVSETPKGVVSGWFNQQAKVGDVIEASKPFSGSIVQNHTHGKICMIAGGSGIAPMMSYVQQLRKEERPFNLLYSARSDDICYGKELSALPNEYIYINISDQNGRIDADRIKESLRGCSSVYICGSKSFVNSCKEMCQKVDPSVSIYAESFTL